MTEYYMCTASIALPLIKGKAHRYVCFSEYVRDAPRYGHDKDAICTSASWLKTHILIMDPNEELIVFLSLADCDFRKINEDWLYGYLMTTINDADCWETND